jgi:hypothetical protein
MPNQENTYFEINLFQSKRSFNSANMKRYLSEKNALTVMASLFCFVMMIIAIKNDGNLWEAIAFALAFSFSVELICHRSKEHK